MLSFCNIPNKIEKRTNVNIIYLFPNNFFPFSRPSCLIGYQLCIIWLLKGGHHKLVYNIMGASHTRIFTQDPAVTWLVAALFGARHVIQVADL